MDISRIRYVGFYSGPSYGNPFMDNPATAETTEGFTSIAEAKCRFRERQETSGSWRLDTRDVTLVDGGRLDSFSDEAYCFPATTTEDKLELYAVVTESDGNRWACHEPSLRIVAGPRGGARVEIYS